MQSPAPWILSSTNHSLGFYNDGGIWGSVRVLQPADGFETFPGILGTSVSPPTHETNTCRLLRASKQIRLFGHSLNYIGSREERGPLENTGPDENIAQLSSDKTDQAASLLYRTVVAPEVELA